MEGVPGWLAWYFQDRRWDWAYSTPVTAATVALALGIAAVVYAFGATDLVHVYMAAFFGLLLVRILGCYAIGSLRFRAWHVPAILAVVAWIGWGVWRLPGKTSF